MTVPVPKYMQAAAIVRAQATDGTLRPGQAAPSWAALASLTGFCALTCRKALQVLVSEGVLVPGPTPAARLRVKALPGASPADAARSLSLALAAARRASGLTQPALAALTGYSVTAIGHAETGRLWQSPQFWEKTDLTLAAGGELTRLNDAWSDGTATTAYPSDFPVLAGNGNHRSLPQAPPASLTTPEPGRRPQPGTT